MLYKLIRLFVVLSFLSLVGTGISLYFAYQKFKDNPEALANLLQGIKKSLPHIEEKLGVSKNVQENISQTKDQLQALMADVAQEIPQREFEEKKLIKLHYARELEFYYQDTDVTVETYQGAELEIHYSGKLVSLQKESLIQLLQTDTKIKLIFSTESHQIDSVIREIRRQGKKEKKLFQSKILIPKSYRGKLIIRNQRGDLNISNPEAHMMDLETTEAGEVNLVLNGNRQYYFDLSSIEGNVVNESGLSLKNYNRFQPQVRIQTEQGSITVSKSENKP